MATHLHSQVAETNIGISARAPHSWETADHPEDGPGLGVGLDYGEPQVPGGQALLLGVNPAGLAAPGK